MRVFAVFVAGLALLSSATGALAFSAADLERLRATGACAGCDLSGTDLREAKLRGADLAGADLTRADLTRADLTGADLRGASLRKSRLLETRLDGANLDGSAVYGAAVWGVSLEGARQSGLVITPPGEAALTVDSIETAQLIHLLLDNRKLHDAIDSLTSKVVLILGRFKPERKAVLDAIRAKLRALNYMPVEFDFSRPSRRDLSETVTLLAHMSRFVVADITEAKSIPQELMLFVANLPSVPVQPLLQNGFEEYSMFEHFKRYPWVLAIHRYDGPDDIAASLAAKVIGPAEAKARKMAVP